MNVSLKKLLDNITSNISILRGTNGRSENTVAISLQTYYGGGILTNAAGQVLFTIPTGRVFPAGTTVQKITLGLCIRASSANGTGYYIMKGTSGGSNPATLDSSKNSTFYNAGNALKTITPSYWYLGLDGLTNITVNINAGGTPFFANDTTIQSYINNNAIGIFATDIVVTLNLPS